jgi:hypothetical protein
MCPLDDSEIDWTGFKPDESPIAPLDATTFVQRLRLLSDRAAGVAKLRAAFREQNANDDQVYRNPEPPSRQSR